MTSDGRRLKKFYNVSTLYVKKEEKRKPNSNFRLKMPPKTKKRKWNNVFLPFISLFCERSSFYSFDDFDSGSFPDKLTPIKEPKNTFKMGLHFPLSKVHQEELENVMRFHDLETPKFFCQSEKGDLASSPTEKERSRS